jgi:hypothetical protein
MTDIVACVNGCTRRHPDGTRHPVRVATPNLACHRCTDRLDTWLREIPEHYAALPALLTTATVDPDTRYGRRADPPAPMRLDIIDLLDHRHGPCGDEFHGALGALAGWVRVTAEDRRVALPDGTMSAMAGFLLRHLDWIVQQPFVDDLTSEIRALHRQLATAVGIHPPAPVGHCTATGADGNQCGGPLWPDRIGGVVCGTCGDRWSSLALARLGARIGATA